MDLLIALATGKKIDDSDIASALYEVCDREHSSCNSDCPVYALNNLAAPNTKPGNRGCDTFKNGTAMLEFIREKSK
jgi:hypothetical protein